VIQDTENIWLVVLCTEVMLFQKMLMPQLPQLKPKELSNLLTGVQLVSNAVLTTNHQQLFLAVI
jgi:hypothetical protein